MTPSTYDIYCSWCRDRGQPPPSREWWNKAIRASKTVVFEPDFDIETERREGWAYD